MKQNYEQVSDGSAGQTISARDVGRVLLLDYSANTDPHQAQPAIAGAAVGGRGVILGILLCPEPSGNGHIEQSDDTERYSDWLRNALIQLLSSINETPDASRDIDAVAISRTPLINLLTDHQLAILRLLEEGLSAKNMAARLKISIHTVNYHKRNLYRNLNVSSATEAIRRARESSLI